MTQNPTISNWAHACELIHKFGPITYGFDADLMDAAFRDSPPEPSGGGTRKSASVLSTPSIDTAAVGGPQDLRPAG